MKIALVFLVLIGVVVLGLPFSIDGDSSLTGAIQSFLSYSLTATGLLLGILTIFMARSLSDELTFRQMFLIVTKPIPRWQIIAGKWVGMTTLNAAFLGFSGLVIYLMVQYIQWSHPPIDPIVDAQELQNEVLVARHGTTTNLPNFSKLAKREFEQNREQGRYAQVPDLDQSAELARLARKYEARWRVVGPYDKREFTFERILCDRSKDKRIQLRYKAEVSAYASDEIFRAVWEFGNPSKSTPVYTIPIRHVIGRYHTIAVPADAVAEDNTLTVRFLNQNPFQGEKQTHNVIEFRKSDELEILFVVGSFEGNFLRLLTLAMCKLAFLAAVALMMTTIFSFPVASLASFTVYVLAGAGAFLTESLDWTTNTSESMFSSFHEFLMRSIWIGYQGIQWVLPNFSYYNPVETFVNGRNVSLVWVLQGITELAIIKCTIVLGLAMLFFHRREVAETSI